MNKATEIHLYTTVQKMVETLEYIMEFDNENLSPDEITRIDHDLDYVQVNFFRTPPDGDYQHEVKTRTGISAMDAINLLSVRIDNTMQTLL
jgi:hypothetical protein